MKKTLFIILIAINVATIGFVVNNQKNSSMSLTKAVAEVGEEKFQGLGYCTPWKMEPMCVTKGSEKCTDDC